MEVIKLSKDEFMHISKDVHLYSFKEIKDPSLDTFDFALMAIKDSKPMAYATCIEFDKKSCFMLHGGALPDASGTINVAKGYSYIIQSLLKEYELLQTSILNKNISMIKLALSVGFLINGIMYQKDGVYLHLELSEV